MPSRAVVLRCLAALVAGGLLYLSFPPRPLWFLAPVGIAVLCAVLRGTRPGAGFGYGYLAGLGFLVPLLPWVGVYVGPLPWLALAAVQALAVGLFGAVSAVLVRLPGAPLWVASAWVGTEWLRSSVPLNGFPWGKLAFGQADGPLLPLASVAGTAGLSLAVALIGACLAALVLHLRPPRARAWAVLGCVLGLLVPLALAATLAGTAADPTEGRTVTVALVQGNVPREGLDFNSQRRAVLDNHVAETERLAADVAAGRVPQPELVIWPENASDIDPLANADATALVARAARAVKVPILVGAVLVNVDRTTSNVAIVWDPAAGPGQQHVKRVLVPFGEYLPARNFFRHFSSYADLAGRFVPGDGNGVVDLNGVPLAVATCYEVAFDYLVNDSVRAGAQLITVPTNNATFGRTEMTYQQLAMSQVRAVEHDRAVLVAATTGASAAIAPDGAVLSQTSLFTPATLVAQVPLRTTTTLATRLGNLPPAAISTLAVLALGAALVRPRWSRGDEPRHDTATADEEDVHGGARSSARD
ncbi:apolipoprotein N-acyltransferase [Rhodococcus sp. X156]|uniref:apolipoprotein N-acyltransferase n=1 Tax=Rhodococcus sp. X156 TaxID=2499145 RepID=UPI001F494245|nr:apolipoprotein N-acyltransferase [Rhodococcus sp. X156]